VLAHEMVRATAASSQWHAHAAGEPRGDWVGMGGRVASWDGREATMNVASEAIVKPAKCVM
jgi:hypothetical protein